METSPQVLPQQFAESMKHEFEEFAEQVMEAVNDASDGGNKGPELFCSLLQE